MPRVERRRSHPPCHSPWLQLGTNHWTSCSPCNRVESEQMSTWCFHLHENHMKKDTLVQGNTPELRQLHHSNKSNTKLLNATLHWKHQLTLQKSSPFQDCPQSCGCFVGPIAVLVVDPAVHGSLSLPDSCSLCKVSRAINPSAHRR